VAVPSTLGEGAHEVEVVGTANLGKLVTFRLPFTIPRFASSQTVGPLRSDASQGTDIAYTGSSEWLLVVSLLILRSDLDRQSTQDGN
jgi:hypothetical protein